MQYSQESNSDPYSLICTPEIQETTSSLAHSDEEVILATNNPKRRAGRKKFKETRHPVYRGVLAKLEKFKSAFSTKLNGSKGKDAGDKDEDMAGWMGVELKFAHEAGKSNMSRSHNPNDYVVHDPLLEKGKEKFNKMQAKEKRKQREWAGKSLT